jgi:glutamine synthetase
MRGKYLTMDKFESVANSSAGFCDCVFGWDINDKLLDNLTFSHWDKGFPDVSFRLDLSTQRALPYEDTTPFFIAELIPPSGREFHPICPRNLLKRVLARAAELGYVAHLGFEYEFFVFDETADSIRDKGYRNLKPFTPGMFGYSVLRSSVHSDLHRDFMAYCEQMDIPLEGYHSETGPGVLEAAQCVAPALEAADRAALFKTFTKVFFQRRGLMPTFMAKWSPDYPGQGGHVHMSLTKAESGGSAFYSEGARSSMSPVMEHFVAGQVAHMREMCAMAAPTINSYTRLVKGAWAPTAATWAVDNRTTSLRIIEGSPKSQRVEYRLPASDANPYLVAAAALASGLEGIVQKKGLAEPIKGNAYNVQDGLPEPLQLPSTLREAGRLFGASAVARRWFGDEFVEHYAATREWESRQYEEAITDWEMDRYFEIV